MELQRSLGRVEGKVDAVLLRLDLMDRRSASHEERISKLERWKSYALGIAVATSVVVASAWNLLVR